MLQLKPRKMYSVAATVAAAMMIVSALDILSLAKPAKYAMMPPIIGPKIRYDRNRVATSR